MNDERPDINGRPDPVYDWCYQLEGAVIELVAAKALSVEHAGILFFLLNGMVGRSIGFTFEPPRPQGFER